MNYEVYENSDNVHAEPSEPSGAADNLGSNTGSSPN